MKKDPNEKPRRGKRPQETHAQVEVLYARSARLLKGPPVPDASSCDSRATSGGNDEDD